MFHYDYSRSQLEGKAEDLLRAFDPERLYKPKPLDVYEVIEKCIDVPYDWKYLTPDQSILGATAYADGYIWAWPKPYFQPGMIPFKVDVTTGTIIIDSTLTELPDRAAENFTALHEGFHQILHKKCFRHTRKDPYDYHVSTKAAISGVYRPMTDLEIIEWQANYCASAFLMPKDLIQREFEKIIGTLTHPVNIDTCPYGKELRELAHDFNTSVTALKIRLKKLGLITMEDIR